ncbi:helix-turn-helix domain-containing protein [Streptomyces fumanus]|uniref:Transcriptional regulator n=1 Tax=Streptomyces fumanus TaxID=67302 RepID=A0A919AVY5_9ACTN|nr:helix-turn-helix transcriptional regulator [Streptomyces fumanus]GHF26329.1 transcriptional regulator [Streptomyces fumanus]
MAEDDFAGLLRELKERSGLSYGVLGKRLHMSASTLHRYVKGEVVPAEFAPVERLARLCRATPEELLELHRRWIRADALRGVKPEPAGTGEAATRVTPQAVTQVTPQATPEPVADADAASNDAEDRGPGDESSDADGAVTVVGGPPRGGEGGRPRRRAALYGGAGLGVAAALALVVTLLPDGGDGGKEPAGAVAGATASPRVSASASDSASPSASARSGSPSASASAKASGRASASPTGAGKPNATAEAAAPAGRAGVPEETGTPITVQTSPYYWDVPCEQDFLIDRSPQNVPKPPPQQDVVGYAASLGAVAADRQQVALTVQGTGTQTVVLRGLHVRVVGSGAPLDWNRYTMGVGCGGGIGPKSFDVSLDLGNPLATPINGQRDFPYKVSESDPEVFYVTAHTSGHDVRWYLELDWSSGSRTGTVRIDDHGKPFRTSAAGKDYYGWMLGGTKWDHFDGN